MFLVSASYNRKHEKSSKTFRGKFGAIFGAKFGATILKIRRTFLLQLLWPKESQLLYDTFGLAGKSLSHWCKPCLHRCKPLPHQCKRLFLHFRTGASNHLSHSPLTTLRQFGRCDSSPHPPRSQGLYPFSWKCLGTACGFMGWGGSSLCVPELGSFPTCQCQVPSQTLL